MLTLGNYLTPTLLGGKNSQWFTEQIYTQFIMRFNWEQGAALRLPAARAVDRAGGARPAARRPALRRRDAADMIPSLPRPAWLRAATALYVAAFLAFLFLPLIVVAVFAFNDAPYPAPPWRGFTLDWFLGNAATGRVGLFHDSELLGSIWTSCRGGGLGHGARRCSSAPPTRS